MNLRKIHLQLWMSHIPVEDQEEFLVDATFLLSMRIEQIQQLGINGKSGNHRDIQLPSLVPEIRRQRFPVGRLREWASPVRWKWGKVPFVSDAPSSTLGSLWSCPPSILSGLHSYPRQPTPSFSTWCPTRPAPLSSSFAPSKWINAVSLHLHPIHKTIVMKAPRQAFGEVFILKE